MMCGNTSDYIDHPLPKHFVSAHGVSHHAWAPGPPPSKFGAARSDSTVLVTRLHQVMTRLEEILFDSDSKD